MLSAYNFGRGVDSLRLLLGSHGHLASGMATAIEILAGPQTSLTVLDAYVDGRNIDEELKAYFASVPEGETSGLFCHGIQYGILGQICG